MLTPKVSNNKPTMPILSIGSWNNQNQFKNEKTFSSDDGEGGIASDRYPNSIQ